MDCPFCSLSKMPSSPALPWDSHDVIHDASALLVRGREPELSAREGRLQVRQRNGVPREIHRTGQPPLLSDQEFSQAAAHPLADPLVQPPRQGRSEYGRAAGDDRLRA